MTVFQMRPPQMEAFKIPAIDYGSDPFDLSMWGLSDEDQLNSRHWLRLMFDRGEIAPIYSRTSPEYWIYRIQIIEDIKKRSNPDEVVQIRPNPDEDLYLCYNLERSEWQPWVTQIRTMSSLNRDYQIVSE